MSTKFEDFKNKLLGKAHEFAEEVAPIFKKNDWKYSGEKGYFIPASTHIESMTRQLIESLSNTSDSGKPQSFDCWESGRIFVYFNKFQGNYYGEIKLVGHSVCIGE